MLRWLNSAADLQLVCCESFLWLWCAAELPTSEPLVEKTTLLISLIILSTYLNHVDESDQSYMFYRGMCFLLPAGEKICGQQKALFLKNGSQRKIPQTFYFFFQVFWWRRWRLKLAVLPLYHITKIITCSMTLAACESGSVLSAPLLFLFCAFYLISYKCFFDLAILKMIYFDGWEQQKNRGDVWQVLHWI